MIPETLDPLTKFISTAGPIGILAVIVVAFMRGDIVPGKTHREQLAERDQITTRLLVERNQAFDELREIARLGVVIQNSKRARA
jgi:hypothetical protein